MLNQAAYRAGRSCSAGTGKPFTSPGIYSALLKELASTDTEPDFF